MPLYSCDVAKSEDWSILWQHTEDTFKASVTLLVNNAGLVTNWQKSLDIMLYGTCLGTYLAVDKMSIAKVNKSLTAQHHDLSEFDSRVVKVEE